MDDAAMRERVMKGNLHAGREEKRRLSTMMATAPVQIRSTWESLTAHMDKTTALLILNLIIMAFVVWLLYSIVGSYAQMAGVNVQHSSSDGNKYRTSAALDAD